MPKRSPPELPSTLRRSSADAQRTWAHTLQSAEKSYGPGERARRTAYAALKHRFEKVGDHWEAKAHAGPSDPRAATGHGETFGGVDMHGHTREELYRRATALGVRGRARMTKADLARAIAARQR